MKRRRRCPATARQAIGSTSVRRTWSAVFVPRKEIILVLLYTEINISLYCTQQCQDKHSVTIKVGKKKEIRDQGDIVLM